LNMPSGSFRATTAAFCQAHHWLQKALPAMTISNSLGWTFYHHKSWCILAAISPRPEGAYFLWWPSRPVFGANTSLHLYKGPLAMIGATTLVTLPFCLSKQAIWFTFESVRRHPTVLAPW
jgi:hypothetical protein